jgi:hypothetical protein
VQELHRLVTNAIESGFGDHDERRRLLSDVVHPAWEAAARAEQ